MWESLNTAILKDRAFSILCVGGAGYSVHTSYNRQPPAVQCGLEGMGIRLYLFD